MAKNNQVVCKTKTRLIEGAAIGAALGVAAGLFMASDAGKKLGKDIKHKTLEFYKYLAPRIKKAKKMSEAEFKAFVKNAAIRYSKDKKLTEKEAQHLLKEAHASWTHFKKHL